MRVGERTCSIYSVDIDANIVSPRRSGRMLPGMARAQAHRDRWRMATHDGEMRRPDMSEQLIIFDTTLRDGEQSPGASMTKDEKLRIARQLERLRVDVIEAGFAASNDSDFEAVKAIASVIKESTVCCWRVPATATSPARRRGAAVAARPAHPPSSRPALHMEKKLRMTPRAGLRAGEQAVVASRATLLPRRRVLVPRTATVRPRVHGLPVSRS